MNEVLNEALRLLCAGYSVVPIRLDGTKAPNLTSWKQYQEEPATEGQVKAWFNRRPVPGLGIIGGYVSQGTEALDFDDHQGNGCVFRKWCDAVAVDLLRKMVIYRTPGNGWRTVYRCDTYVDGAKEVLAKRSKDDPLIELLAANVVVVPGGNPAAHELALPYTYLRGHLAEVQRITAAEREELLAVARKFNSYQPPKKENRAALELLDDDRVKGKSDWFASDDFNGRAEWPDILEPHGWSSAGCRGGVEYWTRPGKYRGVSATTNYLDLDLLHVFSSSTPFEADKSYSKFAAYAILNHKGDFSKASKELARRGYGRANQDIPLLYEKIERYFRK